MLRSGETSFEYERVVQPRPKLRRWAAELDGLLAANAAKSAREQLTLIRIFEESCAGAVMAVVTTLCAVTPDGGARSADNPG